MHGAGATSLAGTEEARCVDGVECIRLTAEFAIDRDLAPFRDDALDFGMPQHLQHTGNPFARAPTLKRGLARIKHAHVQLMEQAMHYLGLVQAE